MSTPPLPPEILAYYAAAREAERLSLGHGPLEAERTRELLLRHLPPAPGVVLDVGGGPGAYACWLAGCGYGVHLVDSAPLHVEQAREASARQPDRPLASVGLGDARRLDMPDASVDAVLLMGPLYHLTERGERIVALREAWRVLRRGGLVFAVGISRFASLFSGLTGGLLGDPAAATIVADDLRTGQHRNPTSRHEWFTTAYFHRPEEMPAEVHEAGFQVLETVGVEGPGWVLPDVATRWADPAAREHLLMAARAAEREPTLLGVSAHMMVVGRRPPAGMRRHGLDHEQAGAAMSDRRDAPSDRRNDIRGDPGVAAPRSHPVAEAGGLAGGRPGLRRGARQARGDAGAGHGGGGLCGGARGAVAGGFRGWVAPRMELSESTGWPDGWTWQ